MGRFRYKALDEYGQSLSGHVDAESIGAARDIIAGRGHIPTRVTAVGAAIRMRGDGFKGFSHVRTDELILFTKQFSTMLKAGVTMIRTLETLEKQTENAYLRQVVGQVARSVSEGSNISDALKRHPRVFKGLYTGMIRAGEVSGSLPQVMDRLIYVIEHEAKVHTDVKSALQYPILVVGCLGVAFVVLLTVVVPKFAAVFGRAGLRLPLPTRICLGLSGIISNYWLLILLGIVGSTVGLVLYFRTPGGKYVKDTAMLRIPIIGPLLVKSIVSRFASLFAILQASGVAVLEAMRVLSATIGNEAVARELAGVQVLLEEGRGIAGPLRSARYFTPMLINMVAIGEETGNLDQMLREVSNHYDVEVEYATKRLSATIGPLLIVLLAAMVGFFALAIYMPMWDMAKIAGM